MPVGSLLALEVLVALVLVFPLLVSKHTLPLATFYGEWVSAALFCLFTLSIYARAKQTGASNGKTVPWVILVPLWLILTSLTQAVNGTVDYTGSRLATQLTLAFGAAVTCAAWHLRNSSDHEGTQSLTTAIATAILLAGLLGVLSQWVQLFHLEPRSFGLVSTYFYDTNRRLWGNLNQPNHQATVHGLALVASVWLASRGHLRFPMWLAAVALLESGIVLSGSRTGVLHVGLAACYALIAAWLARGERRGADPMQRPVGLVVAAGAMVAMLLILQPTIKAAGQAFDWRLFDTVAQLGAEDQISARGALWAHAIAMFRAHPWFGVGWGEFGWAQFQQLDQVGVKVEMSLHAHNAILDLLAKTGIVGTVGVGVILLAWLWRVVRVRLWHGDGEERRQTVLVLTWLAMLCAHSMLEYPLHYLYFFLPFCFMLGWLEPSGFGRWRVPLPVARGLALALVAVAAVVLGTMWQDYRRAEAREYASSEGREALPMPRFWFRQHAQADAAGQAAITPENAASLLPAHVAAVHLLPTPAMIARTAWLLALTGDAAQGRQWMERLRWYYLGDEAAQYATIAQACRGVKADARPQAFCGWVADRSRRLAALARD
ncbi:PglL family O-oligosaccharyltransferase [Cupriavidus taiwanensis]|uniref:PglL family O-oligosaccharyltransferase n=1 Tax=Cupriavidus taiwanensis TaxID=164546 RepID=UPI000E101D37|nr:Wzy polymerase domain-containing protein [Cupriavidus taiwanensis]SOY54629.1 putative lipopolysaccharide biosynthesis protein [Cupriavidus taiwanensis]SOY55316.1 putative lipopolysaccharide biosynthesis protein [Cupriavidus taiwanensis]SOY89444.1 putative lipopolysaccharide biosynthesis protein [Cupriavidus taiwanensis]SOZ61630.1 putative lipopolysaccharide biosynthesis protein [Cupriavidus taiwanensis]SOZ81711.1 putative lipopolysaccharide biosynthesis protein [Cupriavidus taiwanensis]